MYPAHDLDIFKHFLQIDDVPSSPAEAVSGQGTKATPRMNTAKLCLHCFILGGGSEYRFGPIAVWEISLRHEE